MPHRLNQSRNLADGRITIFREPQPNRAYAAGIDTAKGLSDGDYDACVILDESGDQVATAVGRWGYPGLVKVLAPVLEWFQPFIVVERATNGLEVARDLYSRGLWMYFQRDNEKRGRPVSERLGHPPQRSDPPIICLQALIGPRDEQGNLLAPRIKVRDAELHSQLCKFGHRPRSRSVGLESAHDAQLVWGAPPGEHDDLVRAAALAAFGLEWLPQYERPKRKLKPTQIGHLLDHESVGEDEDEEPMSSLERASGRRG